MRQRALFGVALVVVATFVLTAPPLAQQAPAGRQSGPGAAGGPQGGPPRAPLPEGPGREQVQVTCTRCHGLNLIQTSWGYTKDGWQDRIATMVKLPPAELDTVSAYLATHYPVKDAPGAVLISGPATVTIKEWSAPTLGSRPHDSHARGRSRRPRRGHARPLLRPRAALSADRQLPRQDHRARRDRWRGTLDADPPAARVARGPRLRRR